MQIDRQIDPSLVSLCHPWFTITNPSYRFLILKLPPPPCAVLLVYILTCIYLFMIFSLADTKTFHSTINTWRSSVGAGQMPRDDRGCQMANRPIGKQCGEGWGRGRGDITWPWVPWMTLDDIGWGWWSCLIMMMMMMMMMMTMTMTMMMMDIPGQNGEYFRTQNSKSRSPQRWVDQTLCRPLAWRRWGSWHLKDAIEFPKVTMTIRTIHHWIFWANLFSDKPVFFGAESVEHR